MTIMIPIIIIIAAVNTAVIMCVEYFQYVLLLVLFARRCF